MRIEMTPTYILTPEEKKAIRITLGVIASVCETAHTCATCPFAQKSGTYCGVIGDLLCEFNEKAKVEENLKNLLTKTE